MILGDPDVSSTQNGGINQNLRYWVTLMYPPPFLLHFTDPVWVGKLASRAEILADHISYISLDRVVPASQDQQSKCLCLTAPQYYFIHLHLVVLLKLA